MFALSVSISTSSSPTATSSPTCFIQVRIVPSSIESDSRGMTISGIDLVASSNSGGKVEDAEGGPRDPVLGRHRGQLQLLGVGQWHLRHPHPLDRRVEVVEAGVLDPRRELGTDPVAGPALL